MLNSKIFEHYLCSRYYDMPVDKTKQSLSVYRGYILVRKGAWLVQSVELGVMSLNLLEKKKVILKIHFSE